MNPYDDGIGLDEFVDWLDQLTGVSRSSASATTGNGCNGSRPLCGLCRNSSATLRCCRCCTTTRSPTSRSADRWHRPTGSAPRCRTRKSARTKTFRMSRRRLSPSTSPICNCSDCSDVAASRRSSRTLARRGLLRLLAKLYRASGLCRRKLPPPRLACVPLLRWREVLHPRPGDSGLGCRLVTRDYGPLRHRSAAGARAGSRALSASKPASTSRIAPSAPPTAPRRSRPGRRSARPGRRNTRSRAGPACVRGRDRLADGPDPQHRGERPPTTNQAPPRTASQPPNIAMARFPETISSRPPTTVATPGTPPASPGLWSTPIRDRACRRN